jgi:hypothetical protein
VQDADITDDNVFPGEVEVDLDMLCTLVLNRVGEEVDDVDVVTVDESALRQWSMELLEELSEPTGFGVSFSHAVGHGVILSLGARAGDDTLALGGPGDEVVTEEHSIARGGPACTGQPTQSTSVWTVSSEEETERRKWRPKSREPCK